MHAKKLEDIFLQSSNPFVTKYFEKEGAAINLGMVLELQRYKKETLRNYAALPDASKLNGEIYLMYCIVMAFQMPKVEAKAAREQVQQQKMPTTVQDAQLTSSPLPYKLTDSQ